MNRLFCSMSIACGFVMVVLAAPARADEIWVAPTYQQDIGGLGVASNTIWPVTAIGAVRLAWAVPNDLQTFQAAKIALIPASPGGAANLSVIICPAQNSDVVTTGCAGPIAVPFTGVANRLVEVDISAIVGTHLGTPGTTYLSVLAFTAPTASTDHIVGLRFAYAPKAPSGVPTLAANTFTGTQTAPAFVGDGSALTNLPVPSGVATLGANTFSGTQTATAFVGNGAGLTNLPFPSGAARLSANTFTATQTIDTGNLDLDPSTATAGNLTKNGTRFLHNFGISNTFLGVNTGNFTMTGANNTGAGESVLTSNTSGYSNTGVGWAALAGNSGGALNTATGESALRFNTTGGANTATGESALLNNSTGTANTAVGQQTLFSNSTGNNNVAVGWGSGVNATTGSNNIYLGANTLGVQGESNTMYLGLQGTQTRTFIAGVRGITTGHADALPVVVDSTGQFGTAPGAFATLGANTFTAGQRIASGNLDLTDGGIDGTGSSLDAGGVGFITKLGFPFLHNYGLDNTFTGFNAGNFTINYSAGTILNPPTGFANTGTGVNALKGLSTGSDNTALGYDALTSTNAGGSNTGIGAEAMLHNTSGYANAAVGFDALFENTGGAANAAFGPYALYQSTGDANTAIGWHAGYSLTTGSGNIYLGPDVAGEGPALGESNTMRLGNSFTASPYVTTRAFIAGVRGTTTGHADAVPVVIDSNGQLGTVSSSRRFKDDIHDMADASHRLFDLRPVTFRYKQAYADGSRPIQFGLVAEEVAAAFPELAVRDANGTVETVHYETLSVLLLNELRKERDEVQQQRLRLDALEERLNSLLAERLDSPSIASTADTPADPR